jgi:hypothetical protein
MHFTLAPKSSARDISYMLAALYLAARTNPCDWSKEGDHFLLPDNRMRSALGQTRRDTIAVEEARWERLRESRISIKIDRWTAPTLQTHDRYGELIVIRDSLDDQVTWCIDPAMIEAFKPRNAADVVSVPRSLLAKARNRPALEMALRLLAFHAAGPKFHGTEKWAPEFFKLRLPLDMFRVHFSVPHAMSASDMMTRFVEPACQDIWDACGMSVEITARRSVMRGQPHGRIRDFLIYAQLPQESPLEKRLREELEAERAKAWRPKQKPRRIPPPLPQVTPNVVALAGYRKPETFGAIPPEEFGKFIEHEDGTIEF